MTLQFQTQHILTNISSETKRTTIELMQETTYRQIFRWYDSDTIYQAENKIRKQATTSNYSLFLSSFIRTHLFSHLLRYTLSSLLLLEVCICSVTHLMNRFCSLCRRFDLSRTRTERNLIGWNFVQELRLEKHARHSSASTNKSSAFPG